MSHCSINRWPMRSQEAAPERGNWNLFHIFWTNTSWYWVQNGTLGLSTVLMALQISSVRTTSPRSLPVSWRVHHNANRLGVCLIGPIPQWTRTNGGEAGLHPSMFWYSRLWMLFAPGGTWILKTCHNAVWSLILSRLLQLPLKNIFQIFRTNTSRYCRNTRWILNCIINYTIQHSYSKFL